MENVSILVLFGCGLLLIAVSIVIFRKQSQATQCDRHSQRAGQVANIVAYCAILLGIATIALACYFWSFTGIAD